MTTGSVGPAPAGDNEAWAEPGPLTVGFFIQHLPPYLGGAEIQAAALAENLVRRGHRVEIATTRFRRDLASRSESRGVQVWRLPTVAARSLKIPINFLMGCVAGLTLGRRVDIFHAHCLSPFSLGVTLAARFLRKPVLVKLCSLGENGDIARIRGLWPGDLIWRAFRRCDLFVAGTAAGTRELVGHGAAPEQVVLIPSLFPEPSSALGAESRTESRQLLGLPERTTLIYVGRLDRGKGLSVLMDLWPALSRQYPITLLLVGDGPQRGELEDWRARNGLEKSVILAGYRPDPNPWYRAADIFVFPSHSESFGNVIVEAMCHGLAVCTTPVGVVQDWPQEVPLRLIDLSRPKEIAATLGELIEDEPARLRQGQQAMEFIRGRYGAVAVTGQYLQAYRRLLADL